MFYRAWPGSSFLHVELYFLCGINGNKHTLTYTGSQGIHFFNTWWICLLRFSGIVVVVSARIVEWRHKYITWKGLGTRIGQIRHFVFIAGHIVIVPGTSARLYSIDYLLRGDFAELKEITVSINRFVLLPFYVRTECFQKWLQGDLITKR